MKTTKEIRREKTLEVKVCLQPGLWRILQLMVLVGVGVVAAVVVVVGEEDEIQGVGQMLKGGVLTMRSSERKRRN
jgi:hypothetical protein